MSFFITFPITVYIAILRGKMDEKSIENVMARLVIQCLVDKVAVNGIHKNYSSIPPAQMESLYGLSFHVFGVHI